MNGWRETRSVTACRGGDFDIAPLANRMAAKDVS
jgi:hypothetical protein